MHVLGKRGILESRRNLGRYCIGDEGDKNQHASCAQTVLIDTTASIHMVTAESRYFRRVVDRIARSVRVTGARERSSATPKGTVVLRLQN